MNTFLGPGQNTDFGYQTRLAVNGFWVLDETADCFWTPDTRRKKERKRKRDILMKINDPILYLDTIFMTWRCNPTI